MIGTQMMLKGILKILNMFEQGKHLTIIDDEGKIAKQQQIYIINESCGW